MVLPKTANTSSRLFLLSEKEKDNYFIYFTANDYYMSIANILISYTA